MTVPDLLPLSFVTDEGYGSRARLGLIVLQSDQTIEAEARMLNIDGVHFYHSRIPNDVEVTRRTLTDMEQRLPVAAGLLPTDFGFDAIGYGCTSAAALIGEAGVTACIQAAHPGVTCSTPITAAVAAFHALEARRIAVLAVAAPHQRTNQRPATPLAAQRHQPQHRPSTPRTDPRLAQHDAPQTPRLGLSTQRLH